ncbi:MAG: hypothetical protein LBL38_00515, partial [Lactobacillales bacterium]|nr:hypothetical protein [Lactobacillales bacterium]
MLKRIIKLLSIVFCIFINLHFKHHIAALKIEEIPDISFGQQKTGNGSGNYYAQNLAIKIFDALARAERGGFRLTAKVKKGLHKDNFEVPQARFSLENVQQLAIDFPMDLSSQGDMFELNSDQQEILYVDPNFNQSERYQVIFGRIKLFIPNKSILRAGRYAATIEWQLENVPATNLVIAERSVPLLKPVEANPSQSDNLIKNLLDANYYPEDSIADLKKRVRERKSEIQKSLLAIKICNKLFGNLINLKFILDCGANELIVPSAITISDYLTAESLKTQYHLPGSNEFNPEFCNFIRNFFWKNMLKLQQRLTKLESEDIEEAANLLIDTYNTVGEMYPITNLQAFSDRHKNQPIKLTNLYFGKFQKEVTTHLFKKNEEKFFLRRIEEFNSKDITLGFSLVSNVLGEQTIEHQLKIIALEQRYLHYDVLGKITDIVQKGDLLRKENNNIEINNETMKQFYLC